jgi:hypothetical protein
MTIPPPIDLPALDVYDASVDDEVDEGESQTPSDNDSSDGSNSAEDLESVDGEYWSDESEVAV